MKTFTKPFASLSFGLLVLRLVLGVIFIAHGSQKVLGWFGGHGLSSTAQFFDQAYALPVFLAYVVAFTEFLGGIAMVLGFLSRIFSLALVIEMAVAIFISHLPRGFFNPGGLEFPLSVLVIALTVFLLGPGEYSLDNELFERFSTRTQP